jgi:putative transposase
MGRRGRRMGETEGIKSELLDQLLAGKDPKKVFGADGLFDELKKALSERILNAEMDVHLE